MTRTNEAIRVVGIAGSLREGSHNRRLLEAARTLAPRGMSLEIVPLADVPLYNQDLDRDGVRPAAVEALKSAVAGADAVLIATPEYNHSIPGVLQNAIDWLSRPAMRSPLAGKPVAIVGSSPGAMGAVRAQQQLKLVLMSTLAHVMPHPGVAVGQVHEKFDGDGELTHGATRDALSAFLQQFDQWVRRMVAGARQAA